MIGAAVGAAALTGALLVGDSMRGSLRAAALGRLGRVDHALVSSRFFREELVSQITQYNLSVHFVQLTPAILLTGAATHADTRRRANRISVIGTDRSFWKLKGEHAGFPDPETSGRAVILNEPLATELGASVGEDILVRLGKPSDISTETLLGRRDDTTATLRLTVAAVIPAEDIGAFSLSPRQSLPKNAYIPLPTLQRALDKRDRVNVMLVACDGGGTSTPMPPCDPDSLQVSLSHQIQLADLGLRLRLDEPRGYLALESEAMLIEPVIELAAVAAAEGVGLQPSSVLTYLANRITKESATGVPESTPGIPHSTVAAIGPAETAGLPSAHVGSDGGVSLERGEILLNEWAAEDLNAHPGDRITLTYYVTGPFGRLDTQRTTFVLRGVTALAGAGADPGWTPQYEGVTDTDNIADWAPPFHMDLSVLRDKDEVYWDRYRATPKAFITLGDGQRLWASHTERFGRLTSIRLRPTEDQTNLSQGGQAFERELLSRIDLEHLGLFFDPVRTRISSAGRGTTDFGMLFIGFSFFLIVSAAMLVALLFRLGVERRAGEIGLLLATGFTPRTVAKLLIAEGAVLAAVGGIVGVAGSFGYAWFMLTGLRSWWSDAVNTPFLQLHATPQTLLIGLVASFLVATVSVAWSIRGLTRLSAHSLLAGTVASGSRLVTSRHGRFAKAVAVCTFASAVIIMALSLATRSVPQALAFFGSGAMLLVSFLSYLSSRLQTEDVERIVSTRGHNALTRLGIRNARRHRGRSVLTAALVASATFLIAALEAFYLDVDAATGDRHSGTGGFALLAESAVPLVYDLNTGDGREALNVDPESSAELDDVTIMPFRLRPGDESSCLNLYTPTKPRILGATDAMIRRGGFTFSSSMAESETDEQNPWTLLTRTFQDGAIPAIGDESAVKWQLQLGLGKDLTVTGDAGRDVRLRFVALLSGSVLQDEVIVSEPNFMRLFPSISGHGFFLVETPVNEAAAVGRVLERELEIFGFDVSSAPARLKAYLTVQNTYLSTFQMLGGFGLVLGTVGLAAVMLRNVWERRGELALLRAVGFSRFDIGWIVLAENTMLLLGGLLAGSLSALLAIAPHIATRAATIPWLSLAMTLAAVFATGVLAGVVAIVPTLRAPLLAALRTE